MEHVSAAGASVAFGGTNRTHCRAPCRPRSRATSASCMSPPPATSQVREDTSQATRPLQRHEVRRCEGEPWDETMTTDIFLRTSNLIANLRNEIRQIPMVVALVQSTTTINTYVVACCIGTARTHSVVKQHVQALTPCGKRDLHSWWRRDGS